MAPRRWPGIVPATIVVVAMLVLWVMWIGGRVALPDSVRAAGAATGPAVVEAGEDCVEAGPRF